MAHGTPDWGLVGPKQTTYGMDDEGEAAVRLGSPHFFDRRGDVLLVTDFREGMGPFYNNSPAAPARVELHTGHSRSGAYTVGLNAAPTVANRAVISTYAALPFSSLLGLEWTFSFTAYSWFVRGELMWANPINTWYAAVRYNHNLFFSEYLNAGGTYTQIPGSVRLVVADDAMHTIKMVVDMAAMQYVRVLIGEVVYDLRGIGVFATGFGTQSHLIVNIEHQVWAEGDQLAHIDNVILTQNEPPYQG